MKKTTRRRPAKSAPQPSEAEKAFEPIAEAQLADRQVSRARMFGATGLQVGGKVFAMVYKGKLVVKLPRERVQALVASGAGTHFDPGHGRIMKEWVAVAPDRTAEWLGLVGEAKEFVGPEK